MKKNNLYKIYQDLLGPTPDFLKKYLELDFLKRLDDISLLCGMDYASKYAYQFSCYINRFNHSLNTALITYKLTYSKEQALAALFHDSSIPVFSHVIDYMNGDFINQESTEELTYDILNNSSKLKELLKSDGILFDDIVNFKDYSVVDLPRPYLCADRLDNIISLSIAWLNNITEEEIKDILSSTILVINEYGVEEIGFTNKGVAMEVTNKNDLINKLMHSNIDTFMMLLLANIVKKAIFLNILSYHDLFMKREHEIMEILEENISMDVELEEMWNKFKSIKHFDKIDVPPIKNRNLNPLVLNNRLYKNM